MVLIACAHCQRHVFAHERACPFCGTAQRARAIGVAAMATALALGACSAPKYGGPPPPNEGSPRLEDTAAPPPEPTTTAAPTAVPDQGAVAPKYGAPPPPDRNR